MIHRLGFHHLTDPNQEDTMADKMPPCCQKLHTKLAAEQQALTNVSRRAAYHDQQGHNISRAKTMIVEIKGRIADQKQRIVEHEAEHAA